MKKLLFTLMVAASGLVYSQQVKQSPLVLIDGAITTENYMNTINKKLIESVTVYKNSVPDYLKNFENTSKAGVVDVKLKENRFDRITFSQLNLDNKLPADNPVNFEGMLFHNTALYVVHDAITGMQILKQNGKDVLTITTAPN